LVEIFLVALSTISSYQAAGYQCKADLSVS
jgi:hypothetical protein